MLQPPKINKIIAFMITQSQRSWWQVQYESGKVISEWETGQSRTLIAMPSANNSRTSRWEDIPKVGMRGIFLLCPNGKAGALEANGDYSFFQFKHGTFVLDGKNSRQSCEAHIIGKIDGDDGRCVCYAWEYETQRLVRFEDNVTNLAYRGIGQLSLGHHTGVK